MRRGKTTTMDLAAMRHLRSAGVASLAKRLRTLGPYLFIELLLPGGTLISLLLFLYRRGGALEAAANDGPVRPVIVAARIAAGLKSFWC